VNSAGDARHDPAPRGEASGGYKAADMRTASGNGPCENEFTGGIFGQGGKVLYINQQHGNNPTLTTRIGSSTLGAATLRPTTATCTGPRLGVDLRRARPHPCERRADARPDRAKVGSEGCEDGVAHGERPAEHVALGDLGVPGEVARDARRQRQVRVDEEHGSAV